MEFVASGGRAEIKDVEAHQLPRALLVVSSILPLTN